MYTITYSLDQLEQAASFIFHHNKSIEYWPSQPRNVQDVQKTIMDLIYRTAATNMAPKRYADPTEWCSWTGVGGYTLIFTTDGPGQIDVEISVDPAIGIPGFRQVSDVIDDDRRGL
jgi:hypothetical protein